VHSQLSNVASGTRKISSSGEPLERMQQIMQSGDPQRWDELIVFADSRSLYVQRQALLAMRIVNTAHFLNVFEAKSRSPHLAVKHAAIDALLTYDADRFSGLAEGILFERDYKVTLFVLSKLTPEYFSDRPRLVKRILNGNDIGTILLLCDLLLKAELEAYMIEVNSALMRLYVRWRQLWPVALHAFLDLHFKYPQKIDAKDLIPLLERLTWSHSHIKFAMQNWARLESKSLERYLLVMLTNKNPERRQTMLDASSVSIARALSPASVKRLYQMQTPEAKIVSLRGSSVLDPDTRLAIYKQGIVDCDPRVAKEAAQQLLEGPFYTSAEYSRDAARNLFEHSNPEVREIAFKFASRQPYEWKKTLWTQSLRDPDFNGIPTEILKILGNSARSQDDANLLLPFMFSDLSEVIQSSLSALLAASKQGIQSGWVLSAQDRYKHRLAQLSRGENAIVRNLSIKCLQSISFDDRSNKSDVPTIADALLQANAMYLNNQPGLSKKLELRSTGKLEGSPAQTNEEKSTLVHRPKDVIENLYDFDYGIRIQALNALPKSTSIAEYIVAKLDDPGAGIRGRAVSRLAEIDYVRYQSHFLRKRRDSDESVRQAVAMAELIYEDNANADKKLALELNSGNLLRINLALQVIRQRKMLELIPSLWEMLNAGNNLEQVGAALGSLGQVFFLEHGMRQAAGFLEETLLHVSNREAWQLFGPNFARRLLYNMTVELESGITHASQSVEDVVALTSSLREHLSDDATLVCEADLALMLGEIQVLLSKLIDLIQYFKLYSPTRFQSVNLFEVIDEILLLYGRRFDRNGLTLRHEFTGNGPFIAVSDKDDLLNALGLIIEVLLSQIPRGTDCTLLASATEQRARLIVRTNFFNSMEDVSHKSWSTLTQNDNFMRAEWLLGKQLGVLNLLEPEGGTLDLEIQLLSHSFIQNTTFSASFQRLITFVDKPSKTNIQFAGYLEFKSCIAALLDFIEESDIGSAVFAKIISSELLLLMSTVRQRSFERIFLLAEWLHDVKNNLLAASKLVQTALPRNDEGTSREILGRLKYLADHTHAKALKLREFVSLFHSFERYPIDAAKCIDDVLAEFKTTLEQGQILIRREAHDSNHAKLMIVGSEDLLKLLIRNTIGNSIAALLSANWEDRMIIIDLSVTEELLWLIISDNGPGFTNDLLPVLFKEYRSTKREQGGTGLGMATIRQIVDIHDGDLQVGNREEGGARIEILLPLYAGEDEQLSLQSGAPAR